MDNDTYSMHKQETVTGVVTGKPITSEDPEEEERQQEEG
jgi:hypothetical protein